MARVPDYLGFDQGSTEADIHTDTQSKSLYAIFH